MRKRITMILASLFMIMGTAWAKFGDSVDELTGYYLIKGKATDKSIDAYATYNGNDRILHRTTSEPIVHKSVFKFTKGTEDNCYTIQTSDGKYVVYNDTTSGNRLNFTDDHTDANKWWLVREGKSATQVTIVPKQYIVEETAPGWNYSVTYSGAVNTAIGLWNSSIDNSQWTLEEVEEVDLAKYKAKETFGSKIGEEFPLFTFTYDGEEIATSDGYCSLIDEAETEEEVNTIVSTLLDKKYYIRMYNAGRNKERSEKWYVSGQKVVKNGNANSLFIYTADGKLQQVTTRKYLQFNGEHGQNNAYNLTTKADASSFKFSASTRVDNSWSVYDGKGYMCDWGNNNNVFSSWTDSDDWATWAVEEEVFPTPPGKFYRLKSNNNGEYLGNTKSTTLQTSEAKDATTIYYLEAGEKGGQYYFVSYGNGCYFANPWQIGVGTASIPGHNEKFKQYVMIEEGNTGYYAFNYGNGNGNYLTADGTATNYTTDKTLAGAQWTIEEVTTLPVTITAAKYATLYSPVALTIPNGVEAYYGKVNTTTGGLTLIDIETTIPAETGVILYSETAGTYDFEVAKSGTEINDNALTGGFAKSEKNAEKKVYTLQNPDPDSGVGFYLFNGTDGTNTTYINGFRAWLELDPETQVRSLRLTRGEEGGTTTIEELFNTNSESTIYDLQGRRVDNPTKGIYIVNGKKVVIK